MPKAFLVLNPVSGSGAPDLRRRKFEQHFSAAGWEYEIYTTTGTEDLPEIVRRAASHVNLVIASGGDGTISLTASGLLGSHIPLAILPSGTGNMFARDLGIPFDPDRALELILGEHDLINLDIMLAGQRALVMNLSVGLSAQTILHTEREKKQRYGFWAYVGTVFANLLGLRLQNFYLKVDGRLYKFRASEIMLTNSSLIGLRYFPVRGITIQPDDGKIDIFIIRARTVLNWLGVLANVITFHPERNARFKHLTADKSVEINSNNPTQVQGDGEVLGNTPIEVQVKPEAITVFAPCRKNNLLVKSLMARITPLTTRSSEDSSSKAENVNQYER